MARNVSRRDFIKLAAATVLLAGCRVNERPVSTAPADTPTAVPLPTSTTVLPAALTSTPTPPITVADPGETIKKHPDWPGRVVHTHHAGAWDGDTLSLEAISEMLDASITSLTGLNDVTEAWATLFSPGERVAIKVNTISGSRFWTHVPLVMAVTERLRKVGIPAEQIVIFDRYSSELEKAGFAINKVNSGVHCYGTDYEYEAGWSLVDFKIKLSSILLACDALINIPILKMHGITGVSFAMKNHYGTVDQPSRFHGDRAATAIPEINALQPIRDRTRLIIGDVFDVVHAGWGQSTPGDAILMSFDPVAHDALGLRIYNNTMTAAGNDKAVEIATRRADGWLRNSVAMGLGTNDFNSIDVVEVNLG